MSPLLRFVVAVLALQAIAFPQDTPRSDAVETALAEARLMAGELSDRLKVLLGRELAQGGPGGAVRVCSEVALQSTKEFSSQKGRYVRRVSLRNRNPENAPDAFERKALERFSKQQRSGQLPPEYSEVRLTGQGRELYYFKPVVMGAMCLGCHGAPAKISPGVNKILAERYPRDTATGYVAGEVRGAIAIRIPLPPAAAAR